MKAFLIIVVIAILVALGWYFFREESTTNGEETVYCTLDAMQCPDGSYVGRVPPDCEFAACPVSSGSTTTSTSTIDLDASINAS